MTTTIHLVRHGSHDRLERMLCGRMGGVRLGQAGREEAQATAGLLAGEALAAVVSSPLERCRETADAIAEDHGLKVEPEQAFIELDFGDWTGLSFPELEADPRWAPWNDRRSLSRPPDGESLGEAQMRSVRGLEQLRERHPDEAVAVVTHSDIIKALAAHILGLNLDFHHRFDVEPASITTVVLGDWGAKLTRLNAR